MSLLQQDLWLSFRSHKSICAGKPTAMQLRHSPYRRQSSRKASTASTAATSQARTNAQKWTAEEDSMLRDGVAEFGARKWKQVARRLGNRSAGECNARWKQLLGFGAVRKRPWSAAEDTEMMQLVQKYSATKWSVIASHLPGRSGKQCRERWHNQVSPAVKKTPWTKDEDELIVRLQAKFGNSWAHIATYLPGRTDNAVKNRWNSSLKSPAKRRCAAPRGEQPAIRKSKPKKRSRRAKSRPVKLEEEPRAFPVFAADEVAMAAPASAVEEAFTAVAPVRRAGCGDGPSANSIGAAVPREDRGSFSPDAVDNMEMTWCAQAMIDTILDPMGMGPITRSRSFPYAPVRVEQSVSTRYSSFSTSDYYSASSELPSIDPTSPARAPLGLDALLYDPLHDVYGVGSSVFESSALESSDLVLSAPYGEVARVYHRSTLVTDGMECVTYLSPSAPTATYVQPGFDVVKREIPSVECGDFTISELSCPPAWCCKAPNCRCLCTSV